jgi:glutathione S-transferase
MRIYHVATLEDWKQAEAEGTYTTSTLGRTLEDEGFIHAARHDQVPEIRDRYYGDVTEPLVVLEVETDLLDAEVRDEQVGDEVYPHVFGPIPTSAVVAWRPARLPPIELGTDAASPPPPPMTIAFRGLAIMLAAGALAAFACAVSAQIATDDGKLPIGVSFVLWSVTAVLAVPAAIALGYAEWLRRRAADSRPPAT